MVFNFDNSYLNLPQSLYSLVNPTPVKNPFLLCFNNLLANDLGINIEDEKAHITLRDGGEQVIEMLEQELNQRLNKAGVLVTEARISHLAYAAEIAGAMLQRQQATAIVAARAKIVEGAVGMVEMALEQLSIWNAYFW